MYPTKNYPEYLYNDFFSMMDQIIKEMVLRYKYKTKDHYKTYAENNKKNAKAAILDFMYKKIPAHHFDNFYQQEKTRHYDH